MTFLDAWKAQRHRLQPRLSRQRLGWCEKGRAATGPNPTDRGKAGSKRHVLTDANGIPLALTGANLHDSRVLEEIVDAVSLIRQIWAARAGGPPNSTPTRLTITAAAAQP